QVSVWQYLKPQAFNTSKAAGKYFWVVHKYNSQFSSAKPATFKALISSTLIVSYGIGIAVSLCFLLNALFSEPTPHLPYFQGVSTTIVLYFFIFLFLFLPQR